LPARSLVNLRALAEDPDVVAVMAGRFSPVVVEVLPEIQRLKLPLLVPWAAANSITDNDFSPSYVFRLSLTDSWALQVMMREALKIGARKVGLLVPTTEWGRSSLKSAEATAAKDTHQEIVSVQFYNWGEKSLATRYDALRKAGADAVVLVANDNEAAVLMKEMAALPKEQRLPVVAHWGITGGKFFEVIGPTLRDINLSVVQSYTFIGKTDPIALRVLEGLKSITGSSDPRKVASPVGVAHAYDLVHLLARAIKKAKGTDRVAVRNALEKLGPYQGLVRRYDSPFTAKRHDALSVDYLFMATFAADGAIEPMYKTTH
jgi:branched-chain amino acid transport system substrate-binding protein